MASLIAAARTKQRTSPDEAPPPLADENARLSRMVQDARAKLELLAPCTTRKDIEAWFHKHGDTDGVGMLIRVARIPLDDEGCVTHAACGAFEAEARTVVEGLITSNINASVISALLLSIEVPLLVAAIERPEATWISEGVWAADIAFDSLAAFLAPSDPLPLGRAFFITQGACLSISASLAVFAIITAIVNCQPLASFPGPIMTVDFFMQETQVLGQAQLPWLLSICFLILSLPFAAAGHSAASFFYTLLMPVSFLVFLARMARSSGPAWKQFLMLRDEALAVLARVKGEVRRTA